MAGLITDKELQIADRCIEMALEHGAASVRASLSKTVQDTVCTLDSSIDRIQHNSDRSIMLQIFAGGAYGAFSTNRLEDNNLSQFIKRGVETVRMLAPDPCYGLPDKELKASGCGEGDELGLADVAYRDISQQDRMDFAMKCICGKGLSEEGEYSDSLDDNYIVDSDGFRARHIETSYNYCNSVTCKGPDGNLYSGYKYCASPRLGDFDPWNTAQEALDLALAKANPRPIRSGKRNIIVDNSCASRLVSPLFSALNAYSLHQHNSFLEDSLDKQVFAEGFTLLDLPRTAGTPGSRLFDTEGVATSDFPVIEAGTVRKYFVNTYMARKSGLAQTVEGISRPVLMPFVSGSPFICGSPCNYNGKEINLEDIARLVGNGIYITGFNGGNCNANTGNFSFGVEGFTVRDGSIGAPFSEALITGDMKSLWSSLIAAGTDARRGIVWQIPTLAFENIDINA